MPGIRGNSLYSVLGFAIQTLVMLVAFPVLVRRLGAEAFGIFILLTSVSSALTLVDLGFSTATLRLVAHHRSAGDLRAVGDVIAASLWFYGGLGVVGAVAIWGVAPQLVSLVSASPAMIADATWGLRLAGIQFVAFALIVVAMAVFKGLLRFDYATLALTLLSVLGYGVAAMAVVVADIGLIGVMGISLTANFIVLAVCAATGVSLCRATGIRLRGSRPSRATVSAMFGFSAIMTVNSIAGLLLYRAQQYLVGAVLGPASVTSYVLASSVATKAHAVANAISEVMFPLASSVETTRRLRQVYVRMLGASAVVAAVVLLPFVLFPDVTLTLWVGADLARQAAPLLPILAGGCFFLALSPAPYHVVNGIGRPGFNSLFYAINAIANMVLIGVFSRHGMTLSGVAWAFCLANVLTSVLYQTAVEMLIWRRRPLPIGASEPEAAQ
jgi:O-antigen/teichoic acid export membrane protein